MGVIEFQEITWEDLERPAEGLLEMQKTETAGWLIAGVLILLVVAFSAQAQQWLLTEEEIEEIYERRIAWLNRCDKTCEQAVDIQLLDLQKNCAVLTEWFERWRKVHLHEWRLAIDDRASFLGCSGFPHSQADITDGTEDIQQEMQQRIAQEQEARRVQREAETARRLPRYEESLTEGKLLQYTNRVFQDIHNQDVMTITVSSAFWKLPYRTQVQVAQVMWQKWVNIRDPTHPNVPRIRLYNSSGAVVGGSPDDAAQPIWVTAVIDR